MNKVAPPKPKTRTSNLALQVTPMGTNRVGTIIIPDDDDDVVSLLRATPPNNVISVEHYSDDIDLQLREKTRIIDLDDDVQFLHSSANSVKTCEICTETKPFSESFAITGCTHSYCSDCMVKYVCSKLDQNITHVPCLFSGCNMGVLDPESCRRILPQDVFDRWGSALCESVIPTSERFYCPFKDCSALMIDDGGSEAIVEAECQDCYRLFCARCKVPWHMGIGCLEYQNLSKDARGREDIMLMKLAEEKRWTRCPKCKIYVEKAEGCLFILCRCGHTFCYNCGAFYKKALLR